ncbi:MAG: hypothetical protein K6F88_08690 [Ruminococcus sp.]|nr:hypothetical protein [Ruminococcus sp.]
MTFNEEMEKELSEFTNAKRRIISDDERPTVEDWRCLEERIALYVRENESILSQSEINAARSALC